MVLHTALKSLTLSVRRLTQRRSRVVLPQWLSEPATESRPSPKSASQPATPLPDADPLQALAKLIGQPNPFGVMVLEGPRVRQLPFAYHTIDFGPVYAFAITEDGGKARCCTWDDYPVEVAHNDLLPFDPSAFGADEIAKLDRDIDIGGPTGKYPTPRETTIGEWFINQPIFFNCLKAE